MQPTTLTWRSWKLGARALLLAVGACKFPVPADVPDEDATATDAGSGIDARTAPLVTNHQAAELVIGQQDFSSNLSGTGPRALASAGRPAGTSQRLWIPDAYPNDRVLAFEPLPSMTHAAATFALGRRDLFESGDNTFVPPTAANFYLPDSVVEAGGRLFVVDAGRNRVLVWSSVPTVGTTPADLVLGQATFDTSEAGSAPGTMRGPAGIWSDGQRLAIADTFNHRVLCWRTMPVRNGQPPDFVLGQTALDQAVEPGAPTARNVRLPFGVAFDGERFVVSDFGHDRLLIWNGFPDANNAPADAVIGQPDFTTISPNRGARGFAGVGSVLLHDGALFVTDGRNQRVLVFDPIPSGSVADVSLSATQVLGQPDPATLQLDQPTSARSLRGPNGIAVAGSHLFVSDGARVLAYRLTP